MCVCVCGEIGDNLLLLHDEEEGRVAVENGCGDA